MIKMAFRSLKKDLDRAMFYWLVFVLSSMFMVIFFSLSLSDAGGVTLINNHSDLPTWLTVIDTLICMVVIFLANDFFVKNKSKDLAVLLISGGSYLQLVEFLLIQTGFLMLISIPVGTFLANRSLPLINFFMTEASGVTVMVKPNRDAWIAAVSSIGYEVFWCTMLNLGYSYRSTIFGLLHANNRVKAPGKWNRIQGKGKRLFLGVYLICPLLMYGCGTNISFMMLLGVLGLWGMYVCINRVVTPFLEKAVSERVVSDPEKLVYLGLFRSDLKIVRVYVLLFIGSSILFAALTAAGSGQPSNLVLCLLSFALVIPLLSLSLMFRFSTECAGRRQHFFILEKQGFLRESLKRIMKKELICLYGFVLVASYYYVVNILAVLLLRRLISPVIGLAMVAGFLPPLIFCGFFSYYYYLRAAFAKQSRSKGK